MREIYFPSQTCVLACSGPSLNTVDVYSLGLPVVAISTAIRKIHKPDFWIIADFLNEMHGEEGKAAYANPDIIKIVPSDKVSHNVEHKSLVMCEYDTATRWPNINQLLFNGKQPFLRGPHKSVTFGIQWLHYVGVKNIIWAGNDLTATSMREKYCYPVKEFDMKKEYNYQKTLDHTAQTLKDWYPIAQQKGFKWYSWNCGEIFETFVQKYDPTMMDFKNSQPCSIKIEIDIENELKKNEIIQKREVKKKKIIKNYESPQPSQIIEKKEAPKEKFIPPHLRMSPKDPQEIVSERREHRRKITETRKNLRQR
jgi:hypothetical protein